MQIKISTNIKQFSKGLTKFEKKQIPFATAQGINSTLFGLKKEMSKQTEKKLDRPTPATKNGFFIKRANKKTQMGFLAIKDFVAEYLKYQIDGGTRSGSKKIPVPYTKNIKLNKYGNIIGKRRGLIKNPSKQFIATIGGVTGVFEKYGTGAADYYGSQQSKLLIAFKDSVTYNKKPFDFYTIGRSYINNTYNRNLDKAFRKAMRTAK